MVVHVANRRMLPKVRGVIVVDVVEGRAHTHPSTEAINTGAGQGPVLISPCTVLSWWRTGSAVDAIAGYSMLQYIHSRPRHFPTQRDAILWSLQSGTVRNIESARVSLPLQLKEDPRGGFTWRVDLAATERFWTGMRTPRPVERERVCPEH